MPARPIDNGRLTDFNIEYEVSPAGNDIQVVSIVERKEVVVDPTGGLTQYAVTDAASVALSPPFAVIDYARLRVRRTTAGGLASDDTRRYLFYSQFGTDPDDDGVPATGFLVHLDVFYVKIPDTTLFEMIAQTGETFTVHCEWLRR